MVETKTVLVLVAQRWGDGSFWVTRDDGWTNLIFALEMMRDAQEVGRLNG